MDAARLQRHLEPPLHKCSVNFYGFSKETTMCSEQVLSLAPAPLLHWATGIEATLTGLRG